jgi:predicted phosphodiesterase
MPENLRFREDGVFKIAQFADIHWTNGETKDLQTRTLMERVLDSERPDFVMLTGDVIHGDACKDPAQSWEEAVAPLVTRRVPWAAVFGNHDDEGTLSRSQLMTLQKSLVGCLSEEGPQGVPGVGNYALPILSAQSEDLAAVLYAFDSGAYAPPEIGGYGWVTHAQIAWYLETAHTLRESYSSGQPPPALAFLHIPLPEYKEVWEQGGCLGVKYEDVCCPKINTGLFAALREAGDVMGVFVGHDHVNDFEGDLYGVRLCYGRATGYNTYGREGFSRGARIIQLKEGKRSFETNFCLDK